MTGIYKTMRDATEEIEREANHRAEQYDEVADNARMVMAQLDAKLHSEELHDPDIDIAMEMDGWSSEHIDDPSYLSSKLNDLITMIK